MKINSSRPCKARSPGTKYSHLPAFFYGQILLGTAKAISLLIFLFLRHVIAYRRDVIKKNLTSSFPTKSEADIRRLTCDYYYHMSDLVVEPFLFYLAPAVIRSQLARYTNPQMLESLHGDSKHLILFASHYGNWEYLINLPEVTSYPVYTAYSPIKNGLMDKIMMRMRSFLGVRLIPKTGFYKQALTLLKEGSAPKLLIVIADQRPAPGSGKYHIPFLEQQTCVQTGGERIASSTKATVVYVESKKHGRFRYDFTFTLMKCTDAVIPLSITKEYYQILEKSIFHDPGYWLWSHNRWKLQRPAAAG
ncbi:lipid A biosynthesis acyltransferase [Dyadobacter luteus]|uniref:Lipid A biosynthesis acyltransferase n=1 Tax=Dyadobacter luteus TaxID=2259619 RepID=A0A3D8YHS8_9BACT|nr:lysophospholipid acyltransferase family protein [Dyadobacter luteus]REA64342.1 lipid A biosynthesis acyltransferase [Dyadobacter luteus]